jgi:hypothetical protein
VRKRRPLGGLELAAILFALLLALAGISGTNHKAMGSAAAPATVGPPAPGAEGRAQSAGGMSRI